MSHFEKLLEGVEVEWKALGEVSKVLRGKRLTRDMLTPDEKYPVFHGGLEPLGFYSEYNRIGDTVMIINVGASAGTVGFSNDDFWSSDGCFCLEHSEVLNNKFLYYYLIGEQYFLKSRVRVAGIPTLDNFVVEKLQIPIPPLTVQKEIVRILDSFTELTAALTAALTAELTARKQQYNYYREQLLSFEDGEACLSGRQVEWKMLGEITEIKRGKRLVKSELEEAGRYAVFQNSMTPLGYFHESNVKAHTTFIISAGAAGEIGFSPIDFWAADDVYYFITSKNLNNKFLYYYLMIQQGKIKSQVRKASVPRLSKTTFEKMLIPIPSLEEQARIVSILDKFDTLTTSLSEGLPKEIELRQKQYEYFRDVLLTFPKNNIES